jgi:hypothetical protein
VKTIHISKPNNIIINFWKKIHSSASLQWRCLMSKTFDLQMAPSLLLIEQEKALSPISDMDRRSVPISDRAGA